MPERESGMAEEHAGPREAHDLVHLLALFPRVAMDGTALARGLLFAVRALEEPVARVVEQALAPRAQPAGTRAGVEGMRVAPDVEHRLDRALLAAETGCREGDVLHGARAGADLPRPPARQGRGCCSRGGCAGEGRPRDPEARRTGPGTRRRRRAGRRIPPWPRGARPGSLPRPRARASSSGSGSARCRSRTLPGWAARATRRTGRGSSPP